MLINLSLSLTCSTSNQRCPDRLIARPGMRVLQVLCMYLPGLQVDCFNHQQIILGWCSSPGQWSPIRDAIVCGATGDHFDVGRNLVGDDLGS